MLLMSPRKRKQKCDRGSPCMQCVARGPESVCIYERFKPAKPGTGATRQFSKASPDSGSVGRNDNDVEPPVLLQHAQGYGYSNSDTLGSMGMLTKVIDGIDADISSQPEATSKTQSKIRPQYHGYVRRLPPKQHQEILFRIFFREVNSTVAVLDETIFKEQAVRWWATGNDTILTKGPEGLPFDLLAFPALLFEVFALALIRINGPYDVQLDELKFSPSQTFKALASEYIECAESLSRLFAATTPTLTGIQQGSVLTQWLIDSGDLMRAWDNSGVVVRDAMAIGLHLEPQLPSSNQPAALLDALWMNQLKKTIWMNLVCWDNMMAIPLGRPMFIDLKLCTITAPEDCATPIDRSSRIPVPRTEGEKPTVLSERLYRVQMTSRYRDIRALEIEGPIPKDPEKVKELHHCAKRFKKSLPPFFRASNPDTRWDLDNPFVPPQREMLSYLCDSFILALHRPYIFTREESQRQVYDSSLAVLDSQARLFDVLGSMGTAWYMAVTFPTFDAAIMLAVVLVSNPERYHANFERPYRTLKYASQRLRTIGPCLSLANTGADILQTTMRRIVEAQERAGFVIDIASLDARINSASTSPSQPDLSSTSTSSSCASADCGPWQFEQDETAMKWATHDPNFADFDFANLDVPIPLKELFWDEQTSTQVDFEPMWTAPLADQQGWVAGQPEPLQNAMDAGENSLWDFLSGYPNADQMQSGQLRMP
ncbi:hypothetical protein EG328_006565 [Venturia inaequalis]|uniref:Xylanolytic transcriptional activator regulatory domain-containing protein n=2 Tax=Venturia inaequalis TaxID=5025 RepID=A0A8H3VFK5_VENIN|nr:hypothetical protein EG328_006565 [Venturia inaequalis]